MKTALALMILLAFARVAHAGDPAADSERELALLDYDAGHYAQAAGHFAKAAELGDLQSAQALAMMHRYGERLYGSGFPGDPKDADHWAKVAAALKARGPEDVALRR